MVMRHAHVCKPLAHRVGRPTRDAGTSGIDRYRRKNLRKGNVELEFETNESRQMDFLIKTAHWFPILNQRCFEIPANSFFDSIDP
jgi:hypothetical protein